MAHTSLAEQLRKLATPHTKLLVQKKKQPSLLYDPSEAAAIDRNTFFKLGLSGLNDLIEINDVFEEFKLSLFDESSERLERAVLTSDANRKLNAVIKRFLYLLSPYFLLKPTQRTLEWLIARFHVHDYNADELICMALPYHGTRLFARLIQIFDLKHSHEKWQWLYPLQKKGVPLSKTALFNHCASDVSFLKMICEFTVDIVKVYDQHAFKLATLYGFYSTTMVGALQHASDVTELQLTYLLPSLLHALTSDCVDYTASAFVIIATALTKTSFQERLRNKLVEKITAVKHSSLQSSIVLMANIIYQTEDLERVVVSTGTLKNILESSDWLVPALGKFISSGIFPNVFYLAVIRDALRSVRTEKLSAADLLTLVRSLLEKCRVDDLRARKLIEIIIEESRHTNHEWGCELVQQLERQYPNVWDDVVATLLRDHPSESLSRALGLTSINSQVQCFEKLNHPLASIRIEAINYIAKNPDSVKIKYIESSLMARWEDETPAVIEAMFSLPDQLRCCSAEMYERLLLKCWLRSNTEWNSLLLKVVDSLETSDALRSNATTYTILLLPFLVSSVANHTHDSVLDVDLPLFRAIRSNLKIIAGEGAIGEALKDHRSLPTVDDLIAAYERLPAANACVFTLLLLLSASYAGGTCEQKSRILSLVFDKIFPVHFGKLKWRHPATWPISSLADLYARSARRVPFEIAYHFFVSTLEWTPLPEHFSSAGWWDLSDEPSNLVATLYAYLNRYSHLCDDAGDNSPVSFFLQRHFHGLSDRVNFLCNMCFACKGVPAQTAATFRTIDALLERATESYAWTLRLAADNVIVPCVLAFLYSSDAPLRATVLACARRLAASLGAAISRDLTYAELLRHLLQRGEEIALDREQLPSTVYAFLSRDADVQALLPAATRCFTANIRETLLECVVDERTPLPVTAALLPALDFLQDAATIRRLLPLARRLLRRDQRPSDDGSAALLSVVDKFNVNEASVFECADARDFLEYCLANREVRVRETGVDRYLGAVVLRKLAAGLFDRLQPELQRRVLQVVLEICSGAGGGGGGTGTGTDHVQLVAAANSFAKKITLNCELVAVYLERMTSMGGGDGGDSVAGDAKKSKRKSTTASCSQREWNMGVALLELVQNKKKLANCQKLLPVLFDVLQKCCQLDDRLPMEYAKQVCLSCLLNCSRRLKDEHEVEKLQRLFSVELVVNCIRMSPSPQTHHHALLLLAHCAEFAPNQVLHNVMEIFTFMGSSVLRRDDAFSFQIIANILETVVPLLIRRGGAVTAAAIRDVLGVFAVSIPDIPDHRRIPLLLKLTNILNEGEHVHVLAVLALRCAAKPPQGRAMATHAEVVLELLALLPLPRTLECLQRLLEYANALPHDVGEDAEKRLPVDGDGLLDVGEYTNKELHHFKYTLLNFVSTALSNTEFIHRVSVVAPDELPSLEVHFRGMIEQALLYVKSVADYNSPSKTTAAKYWKVMTSQALDVLNKTNALLTSETFLSVVRDLLGHKCAMVQRKTMELLNWRLQQAKDKDEFVPEDLMSLVRPLMKIVSTISRNAAADSTDLKLNQQTALISMKLLTKYYFAVEHADTFKKILSKLCVLAQNNASTNEHVLACLVLCMAELTSSLRVHAIEALPKFVPEFVRLFKRYRKEKSSRNDVVLLSIVTALQKIVETLPNFLSPYLESLLFELACITTHVQRTEDRQSKPESDVKQSNLVNKLKLIRQKVSEIPSRILLPAVSSCFARLCETGDWDAIEPLMNVLAESFPKGGQFSADLTRLFLTMLDFRCCCRCVPANGHGADEERVSQVESYVIDALCGVVLKCSETTFRPFYHKLYDWGVITSKEQSKKERIITYYRILYHVSEKLKSIFVLFASNFIRNAAEMLEKNNLAYRKEHPSRFYLADNKLVLLVDSILKTLYNVFKYDTVKFLTKDRFNMLVEPLVNQIENVVGDYEKRSAETIVPAVARFAAATSDDSLWKQFNYLILLKTRHSSPQIRLTALDVVCTFATHIGDNFLPFLPETVPFLAELLEDENELVEKQTHKAVQRLEQVLEEPIQKYF